MVYVMLAIGGSHGHLMMMDRLSAIVFEDKAECEAAAKKVNEGPDGIGKYFKVQKEPQRWELRCYPLSGTFTHRRL